MLILDTILVVIGSILGLIALYLFLSGYVKLPIPEMTMILVTVFCILLNFVLFFPIALLSTPDKIDTLGNIIAVVNISLILGIVQLLFALWFFLPSMKFNYRNILVVIFLSCSNTAYVVLGFFTMNFVIIDGNIQQELHPVTQGLQGLNQVIIILLIISRIQQLKKISTGRDLLVFSRGVLFSFIAIIFLNILFTFLLVGIGINVPYMMLLIFPSTFFILFGYIVRKDISSFLMLPITLHGIVITHQDTGIVVYSSDKSENSMDTLLGGLFTALNISLQEAIDSESDMNEVAFGDKIVQIAPGREVTTLFIISDKTLMTSHLANFLTRRFERLFTREQILSAANGQSLHQFNSFDSEAGKISKLFLSP